MSNKDTKGKLRMDLIPPRALVAIAKVREFGNNKYGSPWGWLDNTDPKDFITATKRHLLQIDLGEDLDKESSIDHLYHALTSLAMAVELHSIQKDVLWDDIKKEPMESMCMNCYKNGKKKSCKKKFCGVQLT